MSEPSINLTTAMTTKLDEILARRDELAAQLADPEVFSDHNKVRDISIAKAALDPVADEYQRYRTAQGEIADLRAALAAPDEDPELAELAREELPVLESSSAQRIDAVLRKLVTADDDQIASVMLEIRAGVGGDEAGIWARDIMEMYQHYASKKSFSFEPIEISADDGIGGVRAAVITLAGPGVWTAMAHEAGTHCVKRVPATESQGRMHTSTCTVAVLPEPKEVELSLDPADVDEHVTTAQGPGGQNVNKVATAVHLIHKPTGVEVRMQETKSQAQNREKAWRLLRARLYERQLAEQREKEAAERSAQIGSGGRSERIRTYRYKDNIAVDHRLSESFSLQSTLAGDLEPITTMLNEQQTARRLAAL